MKQVVRKSEVRGSIEAPTSKSYAQRAIAGALLAPGLTELTNMDLCSDTRAAIGVARDLGAEISNDGLTYRIRGGLSARASEIHIGESGLATRLFTPIAALCPSKIVVRGEGSILSRPFGMMQSALEALGVEFESQGGFLPLTVQGPIRGGCIAADGSLSSQFITGLLMALPTAERDTQLRVQNLQSIPYVDMTLEVLEAFGIEISHENYELFHIKGSQSYCPTRYNIEGDWSGASCMLVAGAIAGEVTMNNLRRDSRQADRAIVQALESAGARIAWNADAITVGRGELRGFEFDATHCPDLFPALAALAACCRGKSCIRGTQRLTHKESDRARSIADELAKLGVHVDISKENLMIVSSVENRMAVTGSVVDSHNDHRIAMSTAVLALVLDLPTSIDRAEAVDKSYPTFWQELHKIASNI